MKSGNDNLSGFDDDLGDLIDIAGGFIESLGERKKRKGAQGGVPAAPASADSGGVIDAGAHCEPDDARSSDSGGGVDIAGAGAGAPVSTGERKFDGATNPDGSAGSERMTGSDQGVKPDVATNSDGPAGPERTKKPDRTTLGVWAFVAVLVLCLLIASSVSCNKKYYEDWPQSKMAGMVPVAGDQCLGYTEEEGELYIGFEGGRKEFVAYVAECKSLGFTVDVQSDSWEYTAYNEEGYRLSVFYFDDTTPSEVNVNLSVPRTKSDLIWPAKGLATLIPDPGKEKGSIATDDPDWFEAYVGGVSVGEYEDYVGQCKDLGFAEDLEYDDGGKTFDAKDGEGNHLVVEYWGFSSMRILVDAPSMSVIITA